MAGHGDAGFPQQRVAVLVEHAGGRDALLGGRQVLLGEGPIVDEDVGVELAGHGVGLAGRVGIGGVHPPAVIPQHEGVALDDLLDLGLHVLDEARELGVTLRAALLLPLEPGQVVGVVPVHDREVVAGPDARLLEGLVVHRQHVLAVGRVGDLVVGGLGVPHAEAVVVLGGEDGVLDAGLLRQRRPFVRVVLHRVELGGQLLVLLLRDLADVADPLTLAEQGVDTPVDEQAELDVLEPLDDFFAGLGLGGFGHG
ncbi:MAG: hypothetical protein BWY79_02194 [Actinobacteria bacterium ADurb.Bin444]|nr:MAG: hypothetical protein BWY79_02194 [Actinobacteria bacterium ADurb.Bin444]